MSKKILQPEIEVALFKPLIPQNTGNIGRLCTGYNVKLNLIDKLGFELDDTKLKRAGLDYWPHLTWQHWADWESFSKTNDKPIFALTKKSKTSLYDQQLPYNTVILMGSETTGLSEEIINDPKVTPVHIPIWGEIRSYNLANATAMALSECLRQNGFMSDNHKFSEIR